MFIAFCGMDGSGKTTQLGLLAEHLSQHHEVHRTRTPTTWFRADQDMRELIEGRLSTEDRAVALPEMVLMGAFDRYRHLRTELIPRLRAGQVVLTDRYVYTAYAYALARGFDDLDWMKAVNRYLPVPDLTFYLDISAAGALGRVLSRGDVPRPEEKDEEVIEAVRTAFRTQPWGESAGYHVLDGTRQVEDLAREIRDLTAAALTG